MDEHASAGRRFSADRPHLLRSLGLRALTAAAIAAGLAACGAALLPPGAAAQSGRAEPNAPVAGKPVAPFAIEHEIDGEPAVGVPLELRIAVRPRTPVDEIEVRISVDEGLGMDASSEVLTAPSAGPETPAEWRIVVLPLEQGLQRLRVYAEAGAGGERQGRSAVISIRVPADAGSGGAGPDDDTGAARESPATDGARSADAVRSADKSAHAVVDDSAERGERIIRLPSSPPPR